VEAWVLEGVSDVDVEVDDADADLFSSSFIELTLIPQSTASQPRR
jgi:hypothetical protein